MPSDSDKLHQISQRLDAGSRTTRFTKIVYWHIDQDQGQAPEGRR